MGKRARSKKPAPTRKTAKLEKIFDCPFCGHEQCVECVIIRDENVGKVECRTCGVKYASGINHLEEEVDVYSKWIDACDEANKEKNDIADAEESVERAPVQVDDEIEADDD